jgi:hypothetical protein
LAEYTRIRDSECAGKWRSIAVDRWPIHCASLERSRSRLRPRHRMRACCALVRSEIRTTRCASPYRAISSKCGAHARSNAGTQVYRTCACAYECASTGTHARTYIRCVLRCTHPGLVGGQQMRLRSTMDAASELPSLRGMDYEVHKNELSYDASSDDGGSTHGTL